MSTSFKKKFPSTEGKQVLNVVNFETGQLNLYC